MVKTGVAGADKLCFALLKQLPAGSTQPGELYIAENLMHILLDNRCGAWALHSSRPFQAVHVFLFLGLCKSPTIMLAVILQHNSYKSVCTCTLGLGLVVEDNPTEFSCTCSLFMLSVPVSVKLRLCLGCYLFRCMPSNLQIIYS